MEVESVLTDAPPPCPGGYLLKYTPVPRTKILHSLDVLYLTRNTLSPSQGLLDARSPPLLHLRRHNKLYLPLKTTVYEDAL